MEGGGGSIVINNIPSSAVVANVMNGCERSYERMLPPLPPGRDLPTSVLRNNSNASNTVSATNIAASATTNKNDNVENSVVTKVQDEKSASSITNNQEEGVAGCSGVAACSSSVETAQETSAVDTAESQITTATELGFPAIGSPPADLMVVNTNGFNPLQHAALRGNPG